ncbi:MAG: lamin tail domain-containing protein, partial [Deltaproteobacteria bacterium]|nr:lamin tail domain-containing protein [Deltaproteobacteria bacterium]
KRYLFVIGCAVVMGTAPGCGQGAGGEEEGVVVLPGKEDNFFSTTAQEYMVEGQTTVTIEDSLADADEEVKMARVKELIPLKQVVIGWFLNQYLAEKSEHDSNKDYGGFKALTKNGAYEELGIEAVDQTTYRFTFRQEFGGRMDLLAVLPTTQTEDGRAAFDLKIGKVSNKDMARLDTNEEWYRRSPWSSFDPSKVDESKLDTVTLTVWAQERSSDAWIDYQRLFADGLVTIAVHFGWDYHNEYHLKHSKEIYKWLTGKGFKSPVGSYDELRRDSGPLVKTVHVGGKEVRVEISLFWGKPGTDTDPDTAAGGIQLENDMKESFATKEVIVFSGHSGPFYGFALANWRKTDEGDLDDSEVAGLTMPADTYQLVMAEGCDTYALGEAFRENPAKSGMRNIDVLTTTSFSNAATASSVKDFLSAVFDSTETFGDLLDDLEDNSYWFNTMYGVHGIDDNPHAHPWAEREKLCEPCGSNSDCGVKGNRCTRLGDGEKFCTFLCTADDGCPEGYQCMPVAQGSWIRSHQCVPVNLTCQSAPPEPEGPAVIMNEVFASPSKAADDGDANGDGVVSWYKDEFVELVNVSAGVVDLSGWSLSDSVMTRYVFPQGTELAAGKALLVFGGGEPEEFSSLGGSKVLVATTHRLGLNDKGDEITLSGPGGGTVDQLIYGSEGGKGRSLARQTDGDPNAPWVLHPEVAHSAGLRQDGTTF